MTDTGRSPTEATESPQEAENGLLGRMIARWRALAPGGAEGRPSDVPDPVRLAIELINESREAYFQANAAASIEPSPSIVPGATKWVEFLPLEPTARAEAIRAHNLEQARAWVDRPHFIADEFRIVDPKEETQKPPILRFSDGHLEINTESIASKLNKVTINGEGCVGVSELERAQADADFLHNDRIAIVAERNEAQALVEEFRATGFVLEDNLAQARAEVEELRKLISDATPAVKFVAELASLSDGEVEEMRRRYLGGDPETFRKAAQVALRGEDAQLPRFYSDEQRRSAVRAIWQHAHSLYHGGMKAEEDAVDAVAEALGMRRAGA